MLQILKRRISHFKLASFLCSLAVFLMTSCSNIIPFKAPPASSPPRILSSHQTHALLNKWSANSYKSLPDHSITYKSHHPLVQHFSEIQSGYAISPLTNRTKGIGLASVIKAKNQKNSGNYFTPITRDAYLTNVHPSNLIATQSRTNGKLHTHIDIYDPRTSNHLQHRLAYQPKIVIDYLNQIPGNSTLKFMGLLKPQQYNKFKGFYLAEPYDKNRIPILMIHGLASSPETFMNLSEAINADPFTREKYQIWYYYYPTGTPWIASASGFRKAYRKLIAHLDPNSDDANIRKSILIGHSMGGLISRLAISYPGDNLSQAYLKGIPIEKVFDKAEQTRIKNYFHYKPLTEPSKVIFLATPHQGSRIADGFIGWVTIKAITIPSFILKQTTDVITLGKWQLYDVPETTQKLLSTGESSVDQLKPSNPSLIALNHMQIRKNVTTHSIIGDMGLPILRFNTDGVVSYHSSSIRNSKSESIIPSTHDICGEPKTIEAILKILKE